MEGVYARHRVDRGRGANLGGKVAADTCVGGDSAYPPRERRNISAIILLSSQTMIAES